MNAMASGKILNSDYTISNKGKWLANVVVATHTLFVDGNLIVGGNTTQVTKTDLSISDNTITVNKGEIGSGVSLGTAGIEVDRGSSANVSILWNETYDRWTITTDGTTFANISTSTGAGGSALVDDLAPALGGNLNTYARSIYSSNIAYIKFDDNVAISTTATAPSAISSYNIVYSMTPDGGGSGLYVTNTTNSNRELASSIKAIVYSLVL
jgi:hypothetical protein